MTRPEGPTPGHPSARIQPLPEDVPEDWLAEYDRTPEGRSVSRLAADQDLLTTLALQGYQGRDYDVFQTELAKYGIAVIGGWIRRGLIFERVKARGFGGLPAPRDQNLLRHPDTVNELAVETVALALVRFRSDVLLKNRWVSSGGASLKTFFIGQCLIRFANVYRQWHRHEQREDLPVDPHEAFDLTDGAHSDDVEQRVIDLRETDRGLSLVKDPRVRDALVMTAAGLSQAEIADRLRTTEKTVERMIANHRDRMKRLGVA